MNVLASPLVAACLAFGLFAQPLQALAQAVLSMTAQGVPFRAVSKPGDQVRLKVLASRSGAAQGLNPTLEIRLPAELSFVNMTFPMPLFTRASCTPPAVGSSGSVLCAFFTDGNSALVEIDLEVRINPNVAVGSVLVTRVEVRSDGVDPDPRDNQVDLPTLVQAGTEAADLRMRLTAEPQFVRQGDEVEFSVIIENAGPDVAAWPRFTWFQPSAVAVFDPPGIPRLTIATGAATVTTAEGWECFTQTVGPPIWPPVPSSFTCYAIQLAPGSSTVAFRYRSRVLNEVISDVSFRASAFTPSADPDSSNNSSRSVIATLGWPPPQAIPAHSPWLLIVLVGLLGLSAQRHLRLR